MTEMPDAVAKPSPAPLPLPGYKPLPETSALALAATLGTVTLWATNFPTFRYALAAYEPGEAAFLVIYVDNTSFARSREWTLATPSRSTRGER